MEARESEIEQRVIYLPFYLLLFSLAIIFVWQNTRDRTVRTKGETSIDTPRPALDFTLPDLEGKKISLSDFRGKIVFLNFWATWCPPCAEEMPAMERLYQIYKNEDFVMLTISIDKNKSLIKPYMEKYGLNFLVVNDPENKTGKSYGTTGVPETFIIDKQGYIVHKAVGPRDWDEPSTVEAFGDLVRRPAITDEAVSSAETSAP